MTKILKEVEACIKNKNFCLPLRMYVDVLYLPLRMYVAVLYLPLVLWPVAAQSQNAIEEVVVTASKRSVGMSAHEMGSSISVLSSDTLSDAGITDIDSIVALVPSLNIESFGPGDSEYIVRGINSSGESTVGVYFDESPITGRFVEDGGGKNAPLKLVDIERIEVLKGPQGTLFGANSMGGTVRVITNKPNLQTFEGRASAEIGNTSHAGDLNYSYTGVINVPLINDKLGLRLTGYSDQTEGYIDNNQIDKKDVNDVSLDGIRAQLLFEPNDDFSLLGSVTYQDMELGHNGRVTPRGETGAGGAFFINEGPDNPRPAAPGGEFINTEFSATAWDEDMLLASLTAEYNIGVGVITAAASYYDREILRLQDSTPLNTTSLQGFFTGLLGFQTPPASVVEQPQDRETSSFELRFASDFEGPLQTVVGAFYQREDNRFDNLVINVNSDGRTVEDFVPAAPSAVTGAGAPGEIDSIFGRFLEGERERRAVFGEVSYAVTPTVELTGGARWFRFDIEEEQDNTGPDFLAGTNRLDLDGDETTTTWKVNLTWKPDQSQTYYGEVATGFRPGGTNVSAGIAGIAGGNVPPTFDSDELTNYEVGGKFFLWENRLNLNLAAFWIEWEDIQVQTITEGGFNFIDNAGEAEVLGLEAEGNIIFNNNWSATFGLTYTDAELTEDQPLVLGAGGTSFTGSDGDPIPKIPEFTASIGLIYQFQFQGWDSQIRADYYHEDSSDSDFSRTGAAIGAPNPNFHRLPSEDTLNLNLRFSKNNVTIGLFAMNLTDELIVVDVVSSDQDPFAYITGRPRTIGARVSVDL